VTRFHSELRCIAVHVRNFTGEMIGALGFSTAARRLSLQDIVEKGDIFKRGRRTPASSTKRRLDAEA